MRKISVECKNLTYKNDSQQRASSTMATQVSLHGLPQMDKLKSRENYSTWKFAMRASLQHGHLWGCVKCQDAEIADTKKVTQARSKLILTVDPLHFVHIQNANTANKCGKIKSHILRFWFDYVLILV